jgi:hypothetical protein
MESPWDLEDDFPLLIMPNLEVPKAKRDKTEKLELGAFLLVIRPT